MVVVCSSNKKMSRFHLPAGSKHGLQIIDKLPNNQLEETSIKILNALPIIRINELFPDADIHRLATQTETTKAELSLGITTLVALWKQATFNTIKLEAFKFELTQLSLSDEKIQTLSNIWKTNGETTLNRLRNISHSGIPELQQINWSILIERGTCFEPKKRDIKALLQLETTNQGKIYTKLNFNELQNLHFALQKIQKKMDSITKP